MSTMMFRIGALGAALLSSSCADAGEADPPFETAASETAGTSMDGGACPDAGVEDCQCIQGGLCVGGLVCIDSICVSEGLEGGGDEGNAPKPDVGSDDGGDGDGDGDIGTCAGNCGGAGAPASASCYCDAGCIAAGDCCPDFEVACPGVGCQSNEECADSEVCSQAASGCVPIYEATYELELRWQDYGPVCWDVDECLADAYYEVYVAGSLLNESGYVTDTTDVTWSETTILKLSDDVSFTVGFYDYDTLGSDDYITTWCFRNSADQCWSVPAEVLRAGYWSGYTSTSLNYLVTARFIVQ